VDWLATGKEIFVIMDFYANGDLQSYLHNPAAANKLEMIQFLQIAIDIAQGMAYLHKRWWKGRIIHCNLNLSHILLDHNLQACISGLRYVKRSDLAKFQFEESEAGRIAPGTVPFPSKPQ
jgi:serine/threonine protein kinase